LPHKRNDKYAAWEVHDLNFSTAILHFLSKHSTGGMLLSKVCFLLGFGYIHFGTYIDHCHEVIHFAHESVFLFFSGSGFLFVNISSQYDQIAPLDFQGIQEENSEILKNIASLEVYSS